MFTNVLVVHTTNIYQIFKTSTTRFPIWAQASIILTLKVDFFDNNTNIFQFFKTSTTRFPHLSASTILTLKVDTLQHFQITALAIDVAAYVISWRIPSVFGIFHA